jgi:hypothetical protein
MDATQLHSIIFIQQGILLVLRNDDDEKKRSRSKDNRTVKQTHDSPQRISTNSLGCGCGCLRANAKLQRLQSHCPAESNIKDSNAK